MKRGPYCIPTTRAYGPPLGTVTTDVMLEMSPGVNVGGKWSHG